MKIIVDHIGGSRAGQRQEFDLVACLRFGRHPSNDVSFDAHRDLDASSRHAELRRDGDSWVLHDIGSSNGTYVGGGKVQQVQIPSDTGVSVEFGAGGPRCRIFVGEPDAVPSLPAPVAAPVGRPARGGPPGRRTVAMMLQAASAQAGGKTGMHRSTVWMRAMFDQTVNHSTRKFQLALIAVVSISLLAIGGVVIWQVRESNQLERERREERERFAKREREQAIKLEAMELRHTQGAGPTIARRYGPAVYLLVVEREGQTSGFCTGFAITARHLGTNAHCVVEARRLRLNNLPVFALQNGGGSGRIPVKDLWKHAEYRGGLTPDVGVVEVDGTLQTQVVLATEESLVVLENGANIFTLGFPGRLSKRVVEAPEATIVNGIIGRITDFRGKQASFADELLVQHNLLTSPGTSGSPVFDGQGRVIAVNAGSYTESRTDILLDPETGQKQEISRSILTPGANYAIRVDALLTLMKDRGIQAAGAGGGTGGTE